MEAFGSLVGIYLPYITFVVFIFGMLYRIMAWSKLGQPSMTLFPQPAGGSKWGVLSETFFFPKLLKSDKLLWLLAWVFHVMLALIALGHLRVIIDFGFIWSAMGMTPADVDQMSATLGGAAGIIICVTTVGIILRRIMLQRVREISSGGDWFALFLILAILFTGNYMRFGAHFDLHQTREWFLGLITFSSITVPDNGMFLWHALFGQLLLIYIPFSKILHFGGIFFSHTALHRS